MSIFSLQEIIFLFEALTKCNIVSRCFTFEMCVSIYIFTTVFCKLQPFCAPLTHLALYQFMFTGWRFWCTLIVYLVPLWILMSHNGYGNLSFPPLLIENVARLTAVRTLQFHSVVGVMLSPWALRCTKLIDLIKTTTWFHFWSSAITKVYLSFSYWFCEPCFWKGFNHQVACLPKRKWLL